MAGVLLLFGIGFLAAVLVAGGDLVRYWLGRRTAFLTWRAPRPPFFGMQVGIGVAVGLLFVYNLLLRPAAVPQLFGEGMMFLYYGCAVPLSTRIERGFYRTGVWCDRGFRRYARIGGLSWREGTEPVLILASRARHSATRLTVPGTHYGAVRRLLRDLIAGGTIHLDETGLHLGVKDEREDA